MSSSAAIIRLHLLGRVHSDQVEAAAEHGLCGGAKGEPTGAYVGVVDQDAVDGIELVEARGEGLEVGWDGMHLAPGGCVLYDAGEVEELEHEETLLGCEIPCRDLAQSIGTRSCPLENTRYPGVGVLHVEDRVLLGMLYGEIQVEVHLRLVGGAHVEVTRHVLPHLVKQLVEGHDVAGPPADLYLLSPTNQLDEPYYLHVQEIPWYAKRHEACPEAWRIAGVIGAKHIHSVPETSIPLVAVVGEIGHHIRVRSIALDEHPVFVVTKIRCRQPDGAIAFVGVSALHQLPDDLLNHT